MAFNQLRRDLHAAITGATLFDTPTLLTRALCALGGPVEDTRPSVNLRTPVEAVSTVHTECDVPQLDDEDAAEKGQDSQCNERKGGDGYICTQRQGHAEPHRARGRAQGRVYREWTRTDASLYPGNGNDGFPPLDPEKFQNV